MQKYIQWKNERIVKKLLQTKTNTRYNIGWKQYSMHRTNKTNRIK